MLKFSELFAEFLREVTVELNSNNERAEKILYQSALVASNYDADIAAKVARAVSWAESKSNILIGESPKMETQLELTTGNSIQCDLVRQLLRRNSKKSSELIFHRPLIVTLNHDLESISKILKVVKHCVDQKRQLLLAVNQLNKQLIAQLNFYQKTYDVEIAVVKLRTHEQMQNHIMRDFSVNVDSKYFGGDDTSREIAPGDCGTCRQLRITPNELRFVLPRELN